QRVMAGREGGSTDVLFGNLKRMAEPFCDGTQHSDGLRGNFGADSVAGQGSDFYQHRDSAAAASREKLSCRPQLSPPPSRSSAVHQKACCATWSETLPLQTSIVSWDRRWSRRRGCRAAACLARADRALAPVPRSRA